MAEIIPIEPYQVKTCEGIRLHYKCHFNHVLKFPEEIQELFLLEEITWKY